MLRLYCWIIARHRFKKFLNRNVLLKSTITEDEIKEHVRNLAKYLYKKKFGEKKC